jgi:hypothetical protein
MNNIDNHVTIQLQYDPRVISFDTVTSEDGSETSQVYRIKLSKKENNGLAFNETGQLIALPKISEDPGMCSYFAGNSIARNYDASYGAIEYVRCDSSVSRTKSGDPLQSNEGVNTHNLISNILGGGE